MADWSAQQYLKFEDQRTRPARDLLAQVPLANARQVFDLGCGPGNSTQLLVERFPDANVIGLDSSPDMLKQARERLPDCEFVQADLRDWIAPAGTDLLYSNATFQWVPDYLAVLRRLLAALPEGGVLAVQIPDNFGEPSHVLMREVAKDRRWADAVSNARPDRGNPPSVETYYDELKPVCARLDIWHTIYHHPLDGAKAIVEWVKGTGLRPYIDPLSPGDRDAFLALYTDAIAKAYPERCDGKSLLHFPRLFLVATR